MVNQHLTCVNECTFMPICIAYYVNTCISAHFGGGAGGFLHVKNWKNLIGTVPMVWLVPKDARACICTFLERHIIDDDPFQPVQFSSGSVEIIFQSTAKRCFFCLFVFLMNCYVVKRYSHHVEDTGRPFSWILYFFHFLLQLVSCPVFLN